MADRPRKPEKREPVWARPPRRALGSVEAQIQKAQREGLFDDLPGQGKPLEDLDEVYDPGWWATKLVQREEISMLPAALEQKRRVERELERIRSMRRESDVRRALEALNAEIAKINASVTSGPSTTIAKLDVEAAVGRWRDLQER
jgi:hypothetical protein